MPFQQQLVTVPSVDDRNRRQEDWAERQSLVSAQESALKDLRRTSETMTRWVLVVRLAGRANEQYPEMETCRSKGTAVSELEIEYTHPV